MTSAIRLPGHHRVNPEGTLLSRTRPTLIQTTVAVTALAASILTLAACGSSSAGKGSGSGSTPTPTHTSSATAAGAAGLGIVSANGKINPSDFATGDYGVGAVTGPPACDVLIGNPKILSATGIWLAPFPASYAATAQKNFELVPTWGSKYPVRGGVDDPFLLQNGFGYPIMTASGSTSVSVCGLWTADSDMADVLPASPREDTTGDEAAFQFVFSTKAVNNVPSDNRYRPAFTVTDPKDGSRLDLYVTNLVESYLQNGTYGADTTAASLASPMPGLTPAIKTAILAFMQNALDNNVNH